MSISVRLQAMLVALSAPLLAALSSDATPGPTPEWTITAGASSRSFVSRTLGSSMVLQRAPQRPRVWGATSPGATVHVTLQPSGTEEVTTADVDGTWRALLPPMAASVGHTITVFSSAGENATLANIAFGDVFLCGGQSNMVFAVPALTNASAETAAADSYPYIRIFTVGIGTQSAVPLRDLKTVREPWQVASSKTVSEDVTPGHTLFATFSAVCWVFGRTVSDALTTAGHTRADGGPVLLGLISNNWGGTRLEQWMPRDAIAPCVPAGAGAAEGGTSRHPLGGADSNLEGRSASDDWAGDGPVSQGAPGAPFGDLPSGHLPLGIESLPVGTAGDSNLYNAMILPYADGPMELSGAIWYQVRAPHAFLLEDGYTATLRLAPLPPLSTLPRPTVPPVRPCNWLANPTRRAPPAGTLCGPHTHPSRPPPDTMHGQSPPHPHPLPPFPRTGRSQHRHRRVCPRVRMRLPADGSRVAAGAALTLGLFRLRAAVHLVHQPGRPPRFHCRDARRPAQPVH